MAFFLIMAVALGEATASPQAAINVLPAWVTALIKHQAWGSRTEIEESVYRGDTTFLVMPADRAPDSGNEHVLYSEDGQIICEFGGFAGHVTAGRCDIKAIKFVRVLFPRAKR